MTTPVVYVDLHQKAPLLGRQKWRWRAISGGNGRILANSADSYTNRQDCLDTISQLFGNATNVYLRQDGQPNQALRFRQ